MKLLPFIVRNALRNRMRTLLTISSIGISLALMSTLYGYVNLLDDIGDDLGQYNRLVVQHAQSLTMPIPIAHVEKIRKMAGVADAIPMSWFGGLYADETIPFTQFGTDAERFFQVFTEYQIPPGQLRAWQEDRGGCVAGRKAAERRGWKIGDRIPIKGVIYPVDLQLTLRGIYEGFDETMLLFHWNYLDKLLEARLGRSLGNAGTITILGESAAVLPQIMEEVDSRFASSEFPTRTMTEKAFNQMFVDMMGNVKGFIRNIGLAVMFTLMLVAANTMAMSIRERVREVAVLRALGFQRGRILTMVLGEAMLISALGGLLGVMGAKLLLQAVDISRFLFLPFFYIPWQTALAGMFLAGVIGLASGLVPAWRAASIPVVDGLRRVG
ncbi:MAG: ABC transporter permease [Acidobacteriota bacterium]